METIKQGNKPWEYLWVFVLVVYAGSATTFVGSITTWENPIGLALPILFALTIVVTKGITFSSNFWLFFAGYVLYNIALTIKFEAAHPRFALIHLISAFLCYVTITTLGKRFYAIFADVAFYLCLFVLFFWGIEQPNPLFFVNKMKGFAFLTPSYQNVASNILVYTTSELSLMPDYFVDLGFFTFVKNAGFAWEPGAFACYTALAIYSNLITNKFNLKKNYKLLVLVIALMTSFSTTGYALLGLLLLFYVFNKQIKYIIWLSPIVFALIIYASTLPFMSEKIVELLNQDVEAELLESIYSETYTPQRIVSFQIDFIDYQDNPIIGIGGHEEASWTGRIGANIATISGIGDLMSVFGSVGLLFFLINLIRTSKNVIAEFEVKNWLFPVILILMISVSYGIILNSLVMCFWLFSLFKKRNST